MTLEIKRSQPLEYTHVRVFRETHQELLKLAHAEKTSLPRLVDALLMYYREAQDDLRKESAVG